uniref:peptidylprolyl isomerase n=1 Tax=Eubacterium cellulosolvens (strain ATCC 43171 / JCM 9499 / 6) TaxID=633697 RepID=I5AUK7_EUBC6
MKRRIAAMVMSLLMAASMTACGNTEATSTSSVASVPVEAVSSGSETVSTSNQLEELYKLPLIEGDYKLSECIKLGNYKGYKLTKTETIVTDAEVEAYIQTMLSQTEVQDENATAQLGDTVNMAYVGKIDGEEFSGGTSDNADLLLGSGQFIDGFETGVVGMKKGETKDIKVKFPDDYSASAVAGKEAVFTVTVNSIKRASQLTDEWVKNRKEEGVNTVEEYRAARRKELQAQDNNNNDDELRAEVWQRIVNSSKYYKLPKKYEEDAEKEYEERLKSAAEGYGLSLDDYLASAGMTQDNLAAQKKQYGYTIAQSRILLEAFCEAEGLKVGSAEYKEELQKVAETFDMTEEELKEQNGEEDVEQYVLTQMAVNKILSYAKITVEKKTSTDNEVSSSSES